MMIYALGLIMSTKKKKKKNDNVQICEWQLKWHGMACQYEHEGRGPPGANLYVNNTRLLSEVLSHQPCLAVTILFLQCKYSRIIANCSHR